MLPKSLFNHSTKHLFMNTEFYFSSPPASSPILRRAKVILKGFFLFAYRCSQSTHKWMYPARMGRLSLDDVI